MAELKHGDIIQANEKAKGWCGTLLIVDEVKSWGVSAFTHIPEQGDAYILLKEEQYEVVGGEAVFMPEKKSDYEKALYEMERWEADCVSKGDTDGAQIFRWAANAIRSYIDKELRGANGKSNRK